MPQVRWGISCCAVQQTESSRVSSCTCMQSRLRELLEWLNVGSPADVVDHPLSLFRSLLVNTWRLKGQTSIRKAFVPLPHTSTYQLSGNAGESEKMPLIIK